MTRALVVVVGARPNFVKVAGLLDALDRASLPVPVRLVHTGQHYDRAMDQAFFSELGIRAPDVNFGVGSGRHAEQTAEIMRRFDAYLRSQPASAVIVVGDVNSTLACSLVAVKEQIPVFHVEAGLRSGDRAMPEEINRIVTDQVSTLLFTTEPAARANLIREGVAPERIHFVGNFMIDALVRHRPRLTPAAATLAELGRPGSIVDAPGGYAVLTLHRPSNVDDPTRLAAIMGAVAEIAASAPVIFPVHPRTAARIAELDSAGELARGRIALLPPIGYRAMLGLMSGARAVLTDSGGVQEEATFLGVDCLTLRTSTERPVTVSEGTNQLVGVEPDGILAAWRTLLAGGGKKGRVPELWDGHAGERAAAVIAAWYQSGAGAL